MSQPLLTAEQVATQLGVPVGWVRQESRRWSATKGTRGIPTVLLGRYRRYRPDAIEVWIAERESAS
jgi:hypothetical protein